MAGNNRYVWIRVLRIDKERVWKHYKRKGVTNAAMILVSYRVPQLIELIF